jgi:hypothetical protein
MGTRAPRLLVFVALAGLVPVAGGCWYAAAGAAAVGTYAYLKGDLENSVQNTPEEVVAAAEKAFEAMDYVLVSSDANPESGKVVGKTADNKDVKVKAKSMGPNATKITVRFGAFGDEAKSRALMDEIEKHLS